MVRSALTVVMAAAVLVVVAQSLAVAAAVGEDV